jgi:putative ABC transport system permease protein
LLTAASLAVSMLLYTLLSTVTATMDASMKRSEARGRLGTRHRGGFAVLLPAAYRREIRELPGVAAVTSMTYYGGLGPDERYIFPTMAGDADTMPEVWWDCMPGKDGVERFRRIKNAAVVGIRTMEQFRWRVGQEVTLRGTLYPGDLRFRIVGQTDTCFNPAVFLFRRDYLEDATGQAMVNLFWTSLRPGARGQDVAARIDRLFAGRSDETETVSEKAFAQMILSAIGGLTQMVRGVGGILVALMMLVAWNTMAMSLRERTGEVALLRALGFSRNRVVGLVVAEAMTLALGGAAVGCVAPLFVLRRGFAIGFGPFSRLVVSPAVAAQGMGAALLIGLLSGLVPAVVAARMPILAGLRRVG